MSSESIKDFKPIDVSLAEDPFAYLQKVFVYFLQSFFAHAEFQSTGMHWIGDPESEHGKTTEMIITSEKPALESIEKVPHMVCILGSGNWAGTSLDQLQRLSMKTGQRTHTDLMPMNMAYHCQAKNGNLARRMAWYASFGTNLFRRMVMKFGRLHQISVGHNISPESGPTAYTGVLASEEVVSVVVTVPFYWQPQWTIRDPAPVLERFNVNLGVREKIVLPAYLRGKPAYSIPIDLYRPSEVVLEQSVEVSGEDEGE